MAEKVSFDLQTMANIAATYKKCTTFLVEIDNALIDVGSSYAESYVGQASDLMADLVKKSRQHVALLKTCCESAETFVKSTLDDAIALGGQTTWVAPNLLAWVFGQVSYAHRWWTDSDFVSNIAEWSVEGGSVTNWSLSYPLALSDGLYAAQQAINELNAAGETHSLTAPYAQNEVDTMQEQGKRLKDFCDAIHYEAAELIDLPFAKRTGEVLQLAYDLDPTTITATRTTPDGQVSVSLTDLFVEVIEDAGLQADFEKQVQELDDDAVPQYLAKVMEETVYWQQQFALAEECRAIMDEHFPLEVREAWPEMSTLDKRRAIDAYVQDLAKALGVEASVVVSFKQLDYDGVTQGETPNRYSRGNCGYPPYDNTIRITIDIDLITSPYNPAATANPVYGLDELLNTATHETRHAYQMYTYEYEPEKVPQNIGSQWHDEFTHYQSSSATSETEVIAYLVQDIEEDARAFAAFVTSERQA